MGNLAGYGPTESRRFLLRYRIHPKLQRGTWVNLGGYNGWLLTIGRNDFLIQSCAEAAKLVESQWGKVASTLRLTRYEGDVLQASTNDRGESVISYLADPISPERFSGRYDPTEQWVPLVVQEDGDYLEVPSTTIISRQGAINIIESHIALGRPIGVEGIV
jgi:hypothetical protein